MGATVDIRPTPDYLLATVTGDYADEDIKSVLLRVRVAADENQSPNILIDCRGLKGDPSLRQRFELVAFALNLRIGAILHGKPSTARTAIVATPPLAHPGRYGVRLLAERNLKIHLCETIEGALDWLGVKAAQTTSQPSGE